MSWTVSTDKIKRTDGSVVVFLIYTDGVRTIKDFIDVQSGITDDYLAVTAKSRIAYLQAQDDAYAAITPGNVTPKDPIPPIPPIPTQDEIDRKTFIDDYHLFVQSKRAIDIGLLDPTSKSYVDLVTKLKAEFKIEYLAFI